MVSSEQHTVFPGEKKTITVAPKPDAAYFGVVALFREPQGKDWFLTYEIAPPKSQPPCDDASRRRSPSGSIACRFRTARGVKAKGTREGGSGGPAPANDDGVKGF